MGACQFYNKYKNQLPDALYRSIHPHEGLKCLAGTPSDQDICILHLPDPEKNSHDFTIALTEAMSNSTIRNSANTGGFHYCFPREFKFSNFLGNARSKGMPNFWMLYFPSCIFFSNPFAGLENIGILDNLKLTINLDSSIFVSPRTYIQPSSKYPSEFLLPRCKFTSVNINGKTYPENVKPDLAIHGNNTNNSKIILSGIKIDGSLILDSISYPIDFGSLDSRYFKGDEVTIENLTITGNISASLIVRYIKIHQRFAIESANFLKHVVFENIQNDGILVCNRAHFLNPSQSLLRGIDFSQGLFYDTNVHEIPLKEIQWERANIRYFAKEVLPILFEEKIMNRGKFNYLEYRDKTWTELEDRYRDLKLNYEKQGNISEANNFYSRMMHSRWKQRGLIKKIFHWESIYGFLSCWGNSVYSSVLVLIFYIIGWGFIYQPSVGLFETEFNHNEFMTALTFSFENTFFLKPEFLTAKSWIGEIIKSTQIILSTIQIFLITLTMKRKIKF